MKAVVKVAAALTVEESGSGLRLRKYRPGKGGESAGGAHEDSPGGETPESKEKRVSDSTGREAA
jgi:hypothetical protein